MKNAVRVLVIDDDESSRAAIMAALGEEYAFWELDNCDCARDYIYHNGVPDIVLLDLMLPGKNGLDFLKELKTDRNLCDIPVIVCTADDNEDTEVLALDIGAEDYLIKPFKPAIVRKRVSNTVNRSRLSRAEKTKMQMVFDNLPGAAAIFDIDEDGLQLSYISDGCINVTGYTAEETLIQCREDLIGAVYPDDRERLRHFPERHEEQGCIVETFRIKCKNGSYRWVSLSLSAVSTAEGIRLYGVFTDVNSELENSIVTRQLVNALPGGVAIYKIGSSIETIYSSEGVPKLSGRTMAEYQEWIQDDLIGNTVYEDDVNKLMAQINECVPQGRPINVLYRLRHKNGSLVWVQLTANKIREEDGCQIYYAIYTIPSEETALYENVVEDSNSAVFIAQKDTRKILYANKEWKLLVNIDTDSVVTGRLLSDIVTDNGHLLTDDEIEQLTEDSYCEYHKISNSGRYVYIVARAIMWNQIPSYICYINDETEVQTNRQHLQQLLDKVPGGIGIYEITRDSISLDYMNDAYVNIVEQGSHETLQYTGDVTVSAVYKKDLHIIEEAAQRIRDGENYVDIHYRACTQSGKFAWIRMIGSVVERRADKAIMYACFSNFNEVMDTQKKLVAEQRLSQQRYEYEMQLRSRLLSDTIIYYQVNVSRMQLEERRFMTQTIEKYESPLSFSQEFWLGAVDKYIGKDYQQECIDKFSMERLKEAFNNGIASVEMPYFHLNELLTDHWCNAVASIIKRPQTGDIIAMIYVRDIDTSRKKQLAFAGIVDEETEFISILNLKNGMAHVIRRSSDCVYAPDSEDYDFAEYLSEFITQNAQIDEKKGLDYALDKIRVLDEINEHSASSYEYGCKEPDGKLHRKRTTVFYLDDSRKDIVVERRDITDMYEEEQARSAQLKEALGRAQEASRSKSAFLSRVSHDMRTPLNGILGLTALMKDKSDWSDIQKDLEQLETSGEYLLNLINDTLDVSKIEHNQLELHPVVCDGRTVFNTTLSLLKPNIESKHINLSIHADNLPFTMLYIDAGRVEQLVMNILSNAIKFTQEGGNIDLYMSNISESDSELVDEIIIQDNGIGISKEFLPHLFEPFSQEDTDRTSQYRGTGLGMTISKQIVELMNGTIEVESEKGRGTRFTIVIHMQKATQQQIDNYRSNKSEHVNLEVLKGKRVLLCEDHPLNTQIAVRLLNKQGIIVDTAENGRIGVKMYEQSVPGYYDAILMDIRMPVMDGLEAAGYIRGLKRSDSGTIPVIAMTANALSDDIEATKKAGMNAHIAKPVEPAKLYAELARQITLKG